MQYVKYEKHTYFINKILEVENLKILMVYFLTMDAKSFKKKRAIIGLTQQELAGALEIAANTVSRYETGNLDIPKTVELALEALEKREAEKELKNSL